MLEGKEDGIQVMYKNETIWATQKAMAQLFDCSTDNIGLHLKIYLHPGNLSKVQLPRKLGNCRRREELSNDVL